MANEVKSWLNLEDVEAIYDNLYGNPNLKQNFLARAKKIASKTHFSNTYTFKNEAALFDLFKSEFYIQLHDRRITCFEELVEWIH